MAYDEHAVMSVLYRSGNHPERFTLVRWKTHLVDGFDLPHDIGWKGRQVLEPIGSTQRVGAIGHACCCRARASPFSMRLIISGPYQSFRLVRKLVRIGLAAKQSPTYISHWIPAFPLLNRSPSMRRAWLPIVQKISSITSAMASARR